MRKDVIVVAIVMLIIWISLLTFLWLKADEITKNPCSICANRTDQKIVCTYVEPGMLSVDKYYYPNWTRETKEVNFSTSPGW